MLALLTALGVFATLLGGPLAGTPEARMDQVRDWLRAGQTEPATLALAVLTRTLDDEARRNEARYLLGRLHNETGSTDGLGYLEALPEAWEPVEDRRLLELARARLLRLSLNSPGTAGVSRLSLNIPGTAGVSPALAIRGSPARARCPRSKGSSNCVGACRPRLQTIDRQRDSPLLHALDEAALEAVDAALAADLTDAEIAELRLRRADVLDALERPDEARRTLDRAAEDGDAPRHLRGEARRRLAIRLQESEPAEAERQAEILLVHYPHTEAGRDAAGVVELDDLSDDERLRRAQVLMRNFRYGDARPELRRLLEHPRLGDEAAWHLGVIGLNKLRDDAAEARRMFQRVLEAGGPHREDALYFLMRTYLKEDRYEEAEEVVERYRRRVPRGKHRDRMEYYSAWMPYDERRCEEAIPRLRDYLRRFGRMRSYARGYLAWCHVRTEDWQGVIDAYEPLIRYGGQLTRGKAWYWQAYALDRLDRRDEAIEKLERLHADYPLTWYDVLGRQMRARWEGREPRASALAWPDHGGEALAANPLDPEAWTWPRLRGRTEDRFERVRRLVALDEIALARREYRAIRSLVERSVPADRRLAFLRFMTHAVEDFKHGWRAVTGGRLGAMMPLDDPDGVKWLLAYPRAYRHLVERLGEVHGVPAPFVWAIMRQESRYHPSMVSAADAIGALQMIPQTAERVGEDLGTPYHAPTFPDPRVGFPFSTFYMAMHDATWRGQLVLTAASYNAGPEPVARWLRENPGASLAFLAEEISYNEARSYARMVAGHMLRNLWLYETDAERRAPLLDRLFPLEVDYDVPDDVGY